MKCKQGYCIICDKEIIHTCHACDKKTPTPDYTEVEIPWSNGSKMKMAVCTECAKERIWKADKTEMTHAVWQAWDETNQSYDREVVIV